MKYIVIIPRNHQNLGIFNDLEKRKDVRIIVAEQRPISNKLLKTLRRIHTHHGLNSIVNLPFKHIWDKKISFHLSRHEKYSIIVLDGALQRLNLKQLSGIMSNPDINGVLILINSMDAGSLSMAEAKPLIKKVNWNGIYSFDSADVKKYGFRELGFCYYSMHNALKLQKAYHDIELSDIYFTGGLKGGREELILSVFKCLNDAKVKTNFQLMYWGKKRFTKKPYMDKIHYYIGWKSYEEVLGGVLRSKVILEILQEGQSGPSLRYYEAVCYNKKLLSNNPNIVHFPYYDSRYMRYFSSPEDIDIAWITEDCDVDYHYKGDFSPVNMLDLIKKDQEEA